MVTNYSVQNIKSALGMVNEEGNAYSPAQNNILNILNDPLKSMKKCRI